MRGNIHVDYISASMERCMFCAVSVECRLRSLNSIVNRKRACDFLLKFLIIFFNISNYLAPLQRLQVFCGQWLERLVEND